MMNKTNFLTHGDMFLSLKDLSQFWKKKTTYPQIIENSLDPYISTVVFISLFMLLNPIYFTELSLKFS